MKLSANQKRVMYSFRRTGTSTKGDMRRETVRYAPALRSLIKHGLIVENKDGSYSLTQEGGSYMPSVIEDDEDI